MASVAFWNSVVSGSKGIVPLETAARPPRESSRMAESLTPLSFIRHSIALYELNSPIYKIML